MNEFDNLVDQMDEIQQQTFAVAVIIDGVSGYRGVFEEDTDEFEGADAVYRTLEIPYNEFPKSAKRQSSVVLVDSGRSFRATRIFRKDKLMVMVLHE